MSIDLAAIRARCEAATPGPWQTDGRPYYGFDVLSIEGEHVGERVRRENAMFIAVARTDIPQLLAEIERLRALVGPEAGPTAGEVTI